MIKHTIFLIAYLYFLYTDFRRKEVSIFAIGLYGFASLMYIALSNEIATMERFIDLIYSICFGLCICLLAYLSREGLGFADGIFFLINGFILTLKENILLFLSGIFVAFIVGIVLYIIYKKQGKENMVIPFMPCFIPAVIVYIICTV